VSSAGQSRSAAAQRSWTAFFKGEDTTASTEMQRLSGSRAWSRHIEHGRSAHDDAELQILAAAHQRLSVPSHADLIWTDAAPKLPPPEHCVELGHWAGTVAPDTTGRPGWIPSGGAQIHREDDGALG
jgi:hypothetical protein